MIRVLPRFFSDLLKFTKWLYKISDLISWDIYIISFILYTTSQCCTSPLIIIYYTQDVYTNRSLLAHLYWVLVHMGRHRVTPPIWMLRKWSGHSQVCSCPPWRIRHRWEQPPLFTAQGLLTAKVGARHLSDYLNSPLTMYCLGQHLSLSSTKHFVSKCLRSRSWRD